MIILSVESKLMRRLIRACAFVKKRGLCRRGGIGVERINGFLRVFELDRGGREGLLQLLAHRGIGVIVLDGLQYFVRVRATPQRALRLRGPIESVLAEQRVVLGFD